MNFLVLDNLIFMNFKPTNEIVTLYGLILAWIGLWSLFDIVIKFLPINDSIKFVFYSQK